MSDPAGNRWEIYTLLEDVEKEAHEESACCDSACCA